MDHWLAQGEVLCGAIAHLLPGVGRDHSLPELRVRGEGDLARGEELCLDGVEAWPADVVDGSRLIGDVAFLVRVSVQPSRMQNHLVVGSIERRGWVTLRTHQQLGEGVPPIAALVLLKQCEGLVLHLGTAVALDELDLKLALLVLEDESLHGGSGVVVCSLGYSCSPLAGLLVEVRRHEERNMVVGQTDFHDLLEAGVEPHKTTSLCHFVAIHLQLQLVEAAISLRVDLLLEVDAIGTVHLVEHLIDGGPHLLHIAGIVQLGSALTSSAVDALDQAWVRGVLLLHRLEEPLHELLTGVGVSEINLEILLGDHTVWRGWTTHLRTDPLETDLLQGVACHRLRSRPDQPQLGHGTSCLGRLGKGRPAWHENHMAVHAVVVQAVVLRAGPLKALLEVLHVAPRLRLHVDAAVHARQPLQTVLQDVEDADVGTPDRANIGQDRLAGMFRLVVDHHGAEWRLLCERSGDAARGTACGRTHQWLHSPGRGSDAGAWHGPGETPSGRQGSAGDTTGSRSCLHHADKCDGARNANCAGWA
mmetsp:Transcript_3316/g.7841  ORF Transcript_3316/g.7841 Transcript_3316/m.7841 type:complete len:532 (-) Transcript_3316:7-1602(-)